MTTVDISTIGPTALHAWLVIAEGLSQHGMSAPAGVEAHDNTRFMVIETATAEDAAAWAQYLDLPPDPIQLAWAASYVRLVKPGWSWSVRCMTDRSPAGVR